MVNCRKTNLKIYIQYEFFNILLNYVDIFNFHLQ